MGPSHFAQLVGGPLVGLSASALIACGAAVAPTANVADASASDATSSLDVATPNAEASVDAPLHPSRDGAPDAFGIDADAAPAPAETDATANADAAAMDSANLRDGACTPPDPYALCYEIISAPDDAAPPNPAWDGATNMLTFHLPVGLWIVTSAYAAATFTGADGGTRMVTLELLVQGHDLVLDLTSTLADPSVQVVRITQLVLVDACDDRLQIATGGSGGSWFSITIQRIAPNFTSSGCQTFA